MICTPKISPSKHGMDFKTSCSNCKLLANKKSKCDIELEVINKSQFFNGLQKRVLGSERYKPEEIHSSLSQAQKCFKSSFSNFIPRIHMKYKPVSQTHFEIKRSNHFIIMNNSPSISQWSSKYSIMNICYRHDHLKSPCNKSRSRFTNQLDQKPPKSNQS